MLAGRWLAGLGVWIAFMATAEPALGWIAVGTTFLVAGLGMATLLAAMPDPQRSGPLTADTETASPLTANTATAAMAASTTTATSTAPATAPPGAARPPALV